MNIDYKHLEDIRKRDADMTNIPSHWVAQWDRRNLLKMLDEALQDIENLQLEINKYEERY